MKMKCMCVIICHVHETASFFCFNSTGHVTNRCENSQLLLATLFCKCGNISAEGHQKGKEQTSLKVSDVVMKGLMWRVCLWPV